MTVLCQSLLPAAALLGFADASRHQTLFAEIDLVGIIQGGQKQQTFHLRNDGGAFVEVATIEVSCPCASIRQERSALPSGQFLTGNVTLGLWLKPEFTGNLEIKAKGLTRSGQQAFVLTIWPQVHSAS